jgi:hypothetical protein
MNEINPNAAVDFILKNASEYARVKSERRWCEEYRKSLKSMLYLEAPGKNIADKEAFAYSHPKYKELLDNLKKWVFEEEQLRLQIEAAKDRIDVWRTQEASNREVDRILR